MIKLQICFKGVSSAQSMVGLGPNFAQWICTKQLTSKYYAKIQMLNGTSLNRRFVIHK